MNYTQFEQLERDRKEQRFNLFQAEIRKNFLKDPTATSAVYTRDKHKSPLKVCRLKSGDYAVVKDGIDIIYKDTDMHVCKVEWIMLTQDLALVKHL